MSSFIEVKNVSKSFKVSKRAKGIPGTIANLFVPKYEEKKAVKDISFAIEQGEMVGFIGPNGAGKSTTIKMLSGILYPDSGEITVNGYVPYKQRKDYVGSIGVVFGQKSQLQWDLPVIDSFELLKAIYRIPEKMYKKNLDRFMDMLDMWEFIDRPVRQLSLGQRMRADIVAALLHSPKIVFFDEPTIGVDVVGKEKIRSFIKKLNAEDKVSMIFTTHDMQDIEKTCNRLIIIDKGSKVYDGSIQNIKEKYGTTRQVEVEFDRNYDISPMKDIMKNVDIKELNEACGRKKQFIFENTEVQIDELMNYLLQNYGVKDINVSEPEIERIIGKIYSGEV
ncbi:MAG: ATP-binding cassette domain-containing protein [Lachnospiraceae bacterium]|nr:ATP-binding cassette domain-containing protein [Lachnospiraceae bacterium]